MKLLEKKINSYTKRYYTLDGVLKYEYYKCSYGYECWIEYDKNGNAIYCKDSDGVIRDKRDKKENLQEVDIEPFTFNKK